MFYTSDVSWLCHPLQNPVDGMVKVSGITATYTCDPGFVLNGNDTRECQNGESWSGVTPICRKRGLNISMHVHDIVTL